MCNKIDNIQINEIIFCEMIISQFIFYSSKILDFKIFILYRNTVENQFNKTSFPRGGGVVLNMKKEIILFIIKHIFLSVDIESISPKLCIYFFVHFSLNCYHILQR